MKILMVCLGNICRSPLAEGIIRNKLKLRGQYGEVDSAGIASYHVGEKPDIRTIKNALSHGIDLSMLRARQFKTSDFDSFDLIYCADKSIMNAVTTMAQTSDHLNKIKLITEEAFPGQMLDIPDPYYGTEADFEKVYQLIDISCEAIIEKHFEKKS